MSVYDSSAYVAEQRYSKLLRRDLRDGALAGLLAGGALILFFFTYDVLWFRPLATPDFLASAFLGGGEPGAETVTGLKSARMAIFTTLHLVTFTLLGVVLARFFRFTAMRKTLLVGALYGLIICTAVLSAGMQVTGTQLSGEPGWPALVAASFAAGIVMVVFLRRVQGIGPS